MTYDGWMWGHGWGWAGAVAMGVAMLLFWGGLITAVVVGVRYLMSSGPLGRQEFPPPAGPEELLARRYARGEIDDDEFRHRVSLLREHRDHSATA